MARVFPKPWVLHSVRQWLDGHRLAPSQIVLIDLFCQPLDLTDILLSFLEAARVHENFLRATYQKETQQIHARVLHSFFVRFVSFVVILQLQTVSNFKGVRNGHINLVSTDANGSRVWQSTILQASSRGRILLRLASSRRVIRQGMPSPHFQFLLDHCTERRPTWNATQECKFLHR